MVIRGLAAVANERRYFGKGGVGQNASATDQPHYPPIGLGSHILWHLAVLSESVRSCIANVLHIVEGGRGGRKP